MYSLSRSPLNQHAAFSSAGLFCFGMALFFTVASAAIADDQINGSINGQTTDLGEIAIQAPATVIGMPGAPTIVLDGPALFERQGASTLGGLLDGLPGLSSTWYGPNSNRPVIRGLDAHRVGIFSNGLPALDASAVSYDHNAPVNPLSLDRVEILRGPQALLYSGGAAGGVIKTDNSAIAMQPVEGVSGRAQLQGDMGYGRTSSAASVDAGNGLYALHLDGFLQNSGNYNAPDGYAGPSLDSGKIRNSADRQRGGTVGFSLTGTDSSIGFSIGQSRDYYGVIVDPATRIDMRSTQYDFKAQQRNLSGFVQQVTLEANHTDYQHQELDDGVPATTFKNKGNSLRFALQSELMGLNWQYGLQYSQFDFSALGDEGFLPKTHTRNIGGFAVGEGTRGAWSYSVGARVERVRVQSDGAGTTGVDRFGTPDSRTFTPASASLSLAYQFLPQWHVIGQLSHNERAPAFDELYANGPHDATGAYELGNANLKTERSNTVEVGLRWQHEKAQFSTTAYLSDYQNYIGLLGTDRCRDEDGGAISCTNADALPEYDYSGVRARIYGVELSGLWPVLSHQGHAIDVRVVADVLHAQNRSDGEPLPRIAPLTVTPALQWHYGLWSAQLEVPMAARQTRVPATDSAGETPGYVMVNARLTRQFTPPFGEGRVGGQWYVALSNLTDRTVYSASSIDTLRLLAPKPGRSLSAGVQLLF
ncbi:TonB-dependent receptor [Halothiobacillus neapolitanus]|uniref:TonB-dependent receptor n=1 Tax=Halothiobacillus neapolitanus (strain ATCC 23641 / DSM 15147 / CIP 104769 / NCIMB 8539 / c2) TaxID=555778 RepID=D0L002_HALNC|nr:TonB-dependent receptor [Halothiobacillus neapolitanus]ACX96025.1 TonB-dependent receptor [Halothiobacillus neapolitanus c2]TDN66333.1 iron complex outermembrane receptor protein [Halothiobacillus neapolitanus]